MRIMHSAVLTLALLFAAATIATAHHSAAAEFDVNSELVLSGVITKLEWTNPHAHVYIDVTGEDGSLTNWNLELASPNVLVRTGWSRKSLQPGVPIGVTGFRAKDNSNYGYAETITFPDGRTVAPR